MLVACECLNIVINLSDIVEKTVTNANVAMKTKFNKGLMKSAIISKKIRLPKLVKTYRYGNIAVHHCLYCGYDIYASYDNSTDIIFDQGWMINTVDLNAKIKNSDFSPCFKILIDHTEFDQDYIFDDEYEDKLSNDAKSWLNDQVAQIETRIRLFTNEQYSKLGAIKKRTYQEHEAISQKLISLGIESAVEIKNRIPIRNNIRNGNPSIAQTLPNPSIVPSYKSDEIFILDDVDELELSTQYFVPDDLDVEKTSRRRAADDEGGADAFASAALISRSLPLPIPRPVEDQILISSGSHDSPVDIPAGIKALSDKLYGNVFGDLP